MMRLALAAFVAVALALLPARGLAEDAPEFQVDYSNPGLSPPHWTLTLHEDGSGHFHSDRRGAAAGAAQASMELRTPDVDRDVEVSAGFAATAFQTMRQHNWVNPDCESHLKVAFQGLKKLSYSGPDGARSCEFNYAKDKDIQALGDSMVALAGTILEGARMEMLLQHDRLGLDNEMNFVEEASKDGRLQELGAIRGVLRQIAGDSSVMMRVRKRAQAILDRVGK